MQANTSVPPRWREWEDESSHWRCAGLEFLNTLGARKQTSRRTRPVSDWNSKTRVAQFWVTTNYFNSFFRPWPFQRHQAWQ